jgi:glycosyltransferase involved in cell wall biosynthesis
LLRKWLIGRTTTIAVNGQSGARYLKKMGADPGSVFSVPYTHVPNYFENIPTERSPEVARRLLYSGRLVELKGLQPFFRALGEWATRHPDRTVEFDLAGSGPLDAELRAIPLPPNVKTRFLGERTISELVECYAGAGILVFPTLSDEWGLVTNEALAAGLPVLGSTYAQSVQELCIEGKTGWRFRTNVPEELAGAIDRAINTPLEELQEMRWTGRRLVSKLTPAYGADRLVESIKVALDDRRGP